MGNRAISEETYKNLLEALSNLVIHISDKAVEGKADTCEMEMLPNLVRALSDISVFDY